MEDKIFIKGDLVVICPTCGLHIPVSIMDVVNEREIMCPARKFVAHPEEHTGNKYNWCNDECKPTSEYHTIKLSKDSLVEIDDCSLQF